MSKPHFVDKYGTRYWFDESVSKHWLDALNNIRIETNRWIIRDKLHRLDGPAVVYSERYCEFWINGNKLYDRYEFAINVIMILLECNRTSARYVFDEIVTKA